MTPEQKAKELIDKYWKMGDIFPQTTYAHAKQCALIAVEEILSLKIEFHTQRDLKDHLNFWNQVRQHLLNL